MLFGVLFICLQLLARTPCEGKTGTKYCSVCRVLVNEAEWLVSRVDPKKRVQVGSFRVDPKGNQNVKEKQYARSEVHIEEIIESVCDKMNLYAELVFDDGTSQMVRTEGFDGKMLDTNRFKLNRDKGNSYKYQCENFLEDHEEEIIALLQLENIPDYERLICGEKLEVCSLDNLWAPMFTLPEAEDEEVDNRKADITVHENTESDAGEATNDNGDDENSEDEGSDEQEYVESGTDLPPSENVDDKTEL